MIEGDEIYDDNEPHYRTLQQLKTALHDRYEAHNWNGMLVLLRQEAPDLPDYLRALLRARAYEGLDSHAAAWAFYDYAAKIDHEQAAYKYFALYSQRLWDNEAAKKQAADLIGDENANAALRLFAGHIILQHHGTADPPKAVIRQLAADLIPALGSAAHDVNVPRDILLAGYGTLALCLEILGDYASAVDVLRLAASDGATPPMRHAYELLKLASQSVPSGIVIDPASLVSSIIDREQSFEDKIETTVMQQLVSHS
jgi:tetratricopeptide (TPR) repeat protein